ncbi:MAG: hypothetical protein K6E24_05745 [bacterium]|nr:hypothetical protein [bacterium]
MYYHYKEKVIIIGKPLYIRKLKEDNLTNEEICELFKDKINNLFLDYKKANEKE